MKIEITPARAGDLNQIQTILKENDLPFSDLTAGLLYAFRVIRKEDDIIATIGAEVNQSFALLRSLAVLPIYRNRGFAARLVTAIEMYLHSLGVQSIYLLTTTAEEYFKKQDYIYTARESVPGVIAETNEFKALCPKTAVCMVKHLANE